MQLTKKESEFVTDGLVYLILQAEKQLAKFEKLKDKQTRDHACNHLSRKIRNLEALKAKFLSL